MEDHLQDGRTRLTERQHDDRREQRPDRRSQVAAELEHGLRETRLLAGRHPRDARPSSNIPSSENPMPIASEYGLGFKSV